MGCEKVRHPTKQVAKRVRKRLGVKGIGLHAYRCNDCLGEPWHLGHMPAIIRRGEIARSVLRRRP